MDSASESSGFSSHVLNQFHEMSQQAGTRGRGSRGRGRGQATPRWHQPQQPPNSHPQQQSPAFNMSSDSFPPLGSRPSAAPGSVAPHHSGPQYQPESQPTTFNHERHGTPREYQERARGHHRGGRHFHPQQTRPQQFVQQSSQPIDPSQSHNYMRPQPRHGQLYNPNASMHYGTAQQQRFMRHAILNQSDYLTGIGRTAYEEHKFTEEEMVVKENFRLGLENVARNALGPKYPDLPLDQVKLKCYGSLANGFALKNCDMDLLLSLPEYGEADVEESKPILTSDAEHGAPSEDGEEAHGFKADVQRILEKAFLDQDYGARLLTQTRVPILRICESPSPELLANLREARANWEQSSDQTGIAQEAKQDPEDPSTEIDTLTQAVTDLSLPKDGAKRGNRGNAGLEFTDACGIQCDVNFSNFVALHNSALLRLYHGWDSRVKEVGVFVKIWAKTRDINTPYRGTLSSYGWILMVLHYLMNVVQPPVIPNLQYLAKTEDSWNPDRKVELFEGFDVRFVQDPQGLQEIRQDMSTRPNRESSGQLLRGFFQYYGTHQGFHWTRDVVSIRTKGGFLSKQAKGWTEAKWQQGQSKTVRNRYLFAIEDPFEIEHNIARTVGHHGIVTIRDEFRRAWAIIEKIGTDSEIPAEEFLSPVTDRVDTLRKDQDAYRKKQMLMRQETEAKEKAMLQQEEVEKTGEVRKTEQQTDGTWGDSNQGNAQTYSSPKSDRQSSRSKLTSTPPTQERKELKTSPWRRRKAAVDSDDEGDSVSNSSEVKQESTATVVPHVHEESRNLSQGFTSRADVLFANGYDGQGNAVAWDIETQEGRWLQWRDAKARRGHLGPFQKESLRELNEQCPYDSRRPNPYLGKPYHNRLQKMAQERPPWPANNPETNNDTRTDLSPANRSQSVTPAILVEESPTRSQKVGLPTVEATVSVEQLRETSNDEGGRPALLTEPAKAPSSDMVASMVGVNIPWDRNTTGGRWLWGRDQRIIKGSWQEVNLKFSTFGKLDTAFPYNPMMTWAELEEKNRLLRLYHRHTIRAREQRPGLSVQAASERSESQPTMRTSSLIAACRALGAEDSSPSQAASTQGNKLAPPFKPSITCPSPSLNVALSNAAPSSDGRPSQDTVSDRAPTTPPGNIRIPDMDFLRMQRLAFFTKQASSSKSEIDTNEQFYLHATEVDTTALADQEFQTPVASRPVVTDLHDHEDIVAKDTEKGNNAIRRPASDFSGPSTEVSDTPVKDDFSPRVPATLYPGVAKGKRPADEDPNIMPIPRSLGFQFDPRQLQDLAVISKGGNGCAREGAEFNIEDNVYEWGGGGMMGYRTDTGPHVAGASSHRTPYEAGRGDDEGLLDELPRQWDGLTATDC